MLYGEVRHPGHSSRDRGEKKSVWARYAGVQVRLRCIPLTAKTDSGVLT